MVDITELEAERDQLTEQVQELLDTKVWLYEQWQAGERQLDDIHSSKMWRIWMSYIRVRKVILLPFRWISSVPGLVGRAISQAEYCLGWCFLGLSSAAKALRARIRRAGSGTHCDIPPVEDAELERARPKVLLAMPYHIYPPNHGGGVRLYNLIKILSKSCDLYLLVFSVTGEDKKQREALEPYCAQVAFHRWVPKHRPDRFGIKPPNAQLFWSEKVADLIRNTVREHGIDIVQLEYTELGQYAEVVPDGVPVILTEIDIAFRTQRRRLALGFMDRYPESKAYGSKRSDLWRLLVHEIEVCRRSDRVHTMSELDGRFLASFLPEGGKSIRVAPNGVDCESLAPPSRNPPRLDVLYVGNFQHLPNVDALDYLVQDVWPILRLKCPEARLTVVGAHADGRLDHFNGVNGIRVVGEVPEVAPYYHSHRILAVPIRAGSGTRLKILEAFAAGIPVVSTTLGAEGIEYEDGRHLVIADNAVTFAAAIEKLLEDDRSVETLAREGLELARSRYDWKWVAAAIQADYADLMLSKTERTADLPERSRTIRADTTSKEFLTLE